MEVSIEIWSSEIALAASRIGVVLIQFAMLGGTIVTNALRQVAWEIARYTNPTERPINANREILLVNCRALQLEFESLAIFFKVAQSVGIGFYLGCALACASIFVERFPHPVIGNLALGAWFSNISFLLVAFPVLFITIAYLVHRLANRRLRGLQEWLHLVRLRYLVKC